MDETPFIMLSTYRVSYFLMRDLNDATNTVLCASPPVCWNGAGGIPPYAAWLYCLRLASQLTLDVKQQLPRSFTPATPPCGYPRGSVNSDDGGDGSSGKPTGRVTARTRKQPDRLAKRQRDASAGQSAGAFTARKPEGGDGDTARDNGTSVPTFDTQLWLNAASSHAGVDAVPELPELSYGQLGISGTYLGGSRRHHVFKVCSCAAACPCSMCMCAHTSWTWSKARGLPLSSGKPA
jgi:hypothetical protein